MHEQLNKVVVFFGGKSVEREVSVITGIQTINKINPLTNKIFPVYIDENGDWFFDEGLKEIESFKNLNKQKLKKVCVLPNCKTLFWNKNGKLKKICEIDAVINCCHGTCGEDGSLSGVFNVANIPTISPNILAGSVSMDKVASKYFFKGLGLKQIEFLTFEKKEFTIGRKKVLEKIQKFGFPVIVKPCSLGSSVGVKKCENLQEVELALNVAFEFDESVIVEKALVDFEEFFCSAFEKDGEIFVSEIEKNSSSMVLDFDEKYLSKHEREFPAKINKKFKSEIQNATKIVYQGLKCKGIIRVDFLFDKGAKTLFVNEANVVPGSLAMGFWVDKFDMGELFDDLISQAKADFEQKASQKFSFESNILSSFEVGAKNKLK